MRFGSEQITAINLENIVKITQNNNNTHRFLKKMCTFCRERRKNNRTLFFGFFFCKIWVYTKNDDQVVPFLWYTYIHTSFCSCSSRFCLLKKYEAILLLRFQFMTLSIFLTPHPHPLQKKTLSLCLDIWKTIWFLL